MMYKTLENLIRDNPATQEVYELIITIRTLARHIADHTPNEAEQYRCEFIAENCTELIDTIRKVQKNIIF